MSERTCRGALGFGAWLLVSLALPAAAAERSQVYSIQGADCASCGERLEAVLQKVRGVRKVAFDKHAVELAVRMAEDVTDEAVLAAIGRAGLVGVVGAGRGAYLPRPEYPAAADVRTLTMDGSAVGPLDRLRVPGKFTVFDVYADWCGPCRDVDARLREVVAARDDVAVRKLNLVDFDTPLAREIGSRLDGLPYVVVFSPDGRRTELLGAHLDKLDKALRER